jgi:hypothetical protein
LPFGTKCCKKSSKVKKIKEAFFNIVYFLFMELRPANSYINKLIDDFPSRTILKRYDIEISFQFP